MKMESLPNEVLINLFLKLSLPEINRLCSAHPRLRNFCQQDYLWQLKTEQRYGTFEKPASLTWQEVYRGLLSYRYYLINIWYKLKPDSEEDNVREIVSEDESHGLISLVYLHFTYLRKMRLIKYIEDIFELTFIFDIHDPVRCIGQNMNPYKGVYLYDHTIAGSHNGISDILPEQGENEDFLDYLNRISGKDVSARLKTYIAILTTPARKPWMLVSFDNPDFILGVKLGCALYALNCRQYLVQLAK